MDSVYKTINGEKVSIVYPYLKFSHKQPTERTHFQRLGKYKMELDIFVRFFCGIFAVLFLSYNGLLHQSCA